MSGEAWEIGVGPGICSLQPRVRSRLVVVRVQLEVLESLDSMYCMGWIDFGFGCTIGNCLSALRSSNPQQSLDHFAMNRREENLCRGDVLVHKIADQVESVAEPSSKDQPLLQEDWV